MVELRFFRSSGKRIKPDGTILGKLEKSLVLKKTHEDQLWFWTITALEQPPSVYNRGYAASGE
jgi:hypothetical protein